MTVGSRVRVLDSIRPARFAGRLGTVAEEKDGEVAVDLGGDSRAWFRPEELQVVLV